MILVLTNESNQVNEYYTSVKTAVFTFVLFLKKEWAPHKSYVNKYRTQKLDERKTVNCKL